MREIDVEKIYFFHFQVGPGNATLAMKFIDEMHCYFGISWCNPNDQFNRAKGRLIAQGRMNVLKMMFNLTQRKSDEKFSDWLHNEAFEIVAFVDPPQWYQGFSFEKRNKYNV